MNEIWNIIGGTLIGCLIGTGIIVLITAIRWRIEDAARAKANAKCNARSRARQAEYDAAAAEVQAKIRGMDYVQTHRSYANDADEYVNGARKVYVVFGNGGWNGRETPACVDKLSESFTNQGPCNYTLDMPTFHAH